MKHTKGEWKWINQTTQSGDYYKVTGEAVSVCNITTRDSKQAEANAKLIAAAPELLEACEQAFNMCDMLRMPTESDLKNMATFLKAAINKATL